MSKDFTTGWLVAREARLRGKHKPTLSPTPGVPTFSYPERDLLNDICIECERRGWMACYSNPGLPTTRQPGEPDLTVYADGGRLFLIELKAKRGVLSKDQEDFHAWAEKLGHRIWTVKTMGQFLEVVA